MGFLYQFGDWLRERNRVRLENAGKLAPHKHVGQRGEDLAHRYLQSQGMRVIGRNWRTRTGSAELDLIAWEGPEAGNEDGNDSGNESGGVMVFVEVKTRTSDEYSAPERQVDSGKRENIAKAAAEYLRRFAPNQQRIRFDVVSVVLGTGEVLSEGMASGQSKAGPEVRHVREAFEVDWGGQRLEGTSPRRVSTARQTVA